MQETSSALEVRIFILKIYIYYDMNIYYDIKRTKFDSLPDHSLTSHKWIHLASLTQHGWGVNETSSGLLTIPPLPHRDFISLPGP